jgi:hypothetical protein
VAYLETVGLAHGFTIRARRYQSQLGYLNNIHVHAQDFVDFPLVYRGLFDCQFSDDGVQIRWLAPTVTFIELGLEVSGGKPAGERRLANTVLAVQVAAIHAKHRQRYGRLRVGHERVRRSLMASGTAVGL